MAAVATVIINETAGIRRFSYPVCTQLTFPPGRVHQSERLALQANTGELSPVQTSAVELWDDGSVKSLQIFFPISMGPLEQKLLQVYISAGGEQSTDVGNPIEWKADEHGFTAAVRKFSVKVDRRSSGLFRSVLDDGKEFMLEGSQGLGIVTSQGHRLQASEHLTSVESIENGPLAGEIRFQGAYTIVDDGSRAAEFTTRMRFTLFKSWVEITHMIKAPPGGIEEVFAHTRLRVDAPTLCYDVGIAGGTYGKIEVGEKAMYRAENEPFQSRWTLSTWKDHTARADVVGIRSIDAPSQREWLHWLDRGKSLALVTENAWFSRGMAYEIDRRGDLTVRFFPALEEYPTMLTFRLWYHFLDGVPHIGAATSPQSIMWPPVVESIVAA
jgi:YetA-like protein